MEFGCVPRPENEARMTGFVRKAWRWLARTDVAAILLALAIVLIAVGSLFPQWTGAATADKTRWEALIRDRYGGLAGLLTALDAFRFFQSPLFAALLVVLVLATLVCTLNRWPTLWRGALRRPQRPTDAVLDAAPHTVYFTASPSADLPERIHRCLRDRGYRVTSDTSRDGVYLRGDRNSLARLGSLIDHLAVLLLFLGAVTSAALGWRAELTVAPGQAAAVRHGSPLTVRNDGFEFLRYPDGSPANYEAQLTVADLRHTISGPVAVNRPLALRGVHFYLSGYQPTAAGDAVILMAVHDPGYGLVIGGGLLLLLGVTVALAFPHCSVHARITADGTLILAGFADRGAIGFGREFAGLSAELRKMGVPSA
jgi:cytochrome c biogenesis protein ResB